MRARFFGKNGQFLVTHIGPDDGGYLSQGYEEYPSPPPSSEHRWDGAAWTLDLSAARARKIGEVKAEAQRRIHERYPQWKQSNMLARVHELRAIETGVYRDATGTLQPARALTADEVAELAAISAAWDWIKQVRAVSDQIEADIQAAADPSAIDVVKDARWPAAQLSARWSDSGEDGE